MIVMIFVAQNNFYNGPGISDRLLGFYQKTITEMIKIQTSLSVTDSDMTTRQPGDNTATPLSPGGEK